MSRVLTGEVSKKGQVVIPIQIRKALGLNKGSKVSFELNNGEITIKKLPTASDWANLVKQIPVEDVKIDEMVILTLKNHRISMTGWLMANRVRGMNDFCKYT